MTSSTLGVASLTDFASRRSACCGVSVAVPVSLAGLGSNWSAPRTVAVLLCGSGLSTRARICSVGEVPNATVPTVQTPLALS
jgi:hypothetical protein